MSSPPNPSDLAPPPRVIDENTNIMDLTDQEIMALTEAMQNEQHVSTDASFSGNAIKSLYQYDSIRVLSDEYLNGNPIFLSKIDSLEASGFVGIIRAKGDGDCFYRALSLAFFLRLLDAPDPGREVDLALQRFDQLKPLLDEAGFQEMVYEDFLEVLCNITKSLALTPPPTPRSILDGLQDPVTSNSVVIILRLYCSSWIRSHPSDFEAFLMSPFTGEMLSIRDFCESQVEAQGVEADHPMIMALSQALSIPIRVAYVDASGSGDKVDFVEFSGKKDGEEEVNSLVEGGKDRAIHLLYRPGHYDGLVRVQLAE